ncbi:hypothetical protein LDO31_13065, partial [Luteimonas sp. XNQY3]|nr:hypothetical protein [Luteimonas sp. XNQY3]
FLARSTTTSLQTGEMLCNSEAGQIWPRAANFSPRTFLPPTLLLSRPASDAGLHLPSARIAALPGLPRRSVLASQAPCAARRLRRADYDI